MDDKELIVATAKEIFLKFAEKGPSLFSINKKGDEAMAEIGDRFNALVKKISQGIHEIKE